MKDKQRLLVISSVVPFPRNSGQQQRVYYKLKALRANFHITFLTYAQLEKRDEISERLLEVCDEVLVLPSIYMSSPVSRLFYRFLGTLYSIGTGLKLSNYVTGNVEFGPQRLDSVLKGKNFDCVLFEYWHAHQATPYFHARAIPTILDMHDILWRSYARQLDARAYLPGWLKRWFVARYKSREESAWNAFDMLIAINQDEYNYVSQLGWDNVKLFYVPMGTDIAVWPYSWQPASPRRIAYYGGLGSRHNQQDAMLCFREIMPAIWEQHPEVEFWIVGSNPPGFIKDLERDERVCVTGFVEQPQDVLNTISLVLCPWSGTYGFRSRVVEVMALGVPVIASTDAVYGMGFEVGHGIFLGNDSAEMAALGLKLLHDESELTHQSLLARRQMEEKFGYEATYVRFSNELADNLR